MITKLSSEHYKYIFNILSELTDAPKLTYEEYILFIKNLKDNHHIYVYLKDDIPVGTITLLLENKLIHSGKSVGHIEDLVVKKEYNKQGIAKNLINHCINISKENNCYKVILDCNSDLEKYYNKSNFSKNGICMRYNCI